MDYILQKRKGKEWKDVKEYNNSSIANRDLKRLNETEVEEYRLIAKRSDQDRMNDFMYFITCCCGS